MALLREAELALMNAPFEADGWRRAVDLVARTTGSSGAQILGIGGPLLIPLNVHVGNYAGYEHLFEDPHLHGKINWRVGSTTTAMEIQHEGHYAAYRATVDTADYDDAVSDLDMPFGCQSAVLLDSNGLLGLALLRTRRDGPCRSSTLRRFARLRYQLARAVRMQLAMDGEAAELMVGDLGSASGVTILLDRHGALSALTPAAEVFFDDHGPLRLDGLALRLKNQSEDRSLHQAMARLLAEPDDPLAPVMHEMRAGRCSIFPDGQWRLSVMRLPDRPHGLGFHPQLAVSLHRAARLAA